jgi:hypothetical protein
VKPMAPMKFSDPNLLPWWESREHSMLWYNELKAWAPHLLDVNLQRRLADVENMLVSYAVVLCIIVSVEDCFSDSLCCC